MILRKTPLLEWKGWTEPAREFLAESDEEIDLLDVVGRYFAKVSALNDWAEEQIAGGRGALTPGAKRRPG